MLWHILYHENYNSLQVCKLRVDLDSPQHSQTSWEYTQNICKSASAVKSGHLDLAIVCQEIRDIY